MKLFFAQAILCLMLSAHVYSQSITMNIRITDSDTLMALVKGFQWCDTLYTQNGKFVYTKKLKQPELLTLVVIRNKQSIMAIREGNERKMRSKDDGNYREFFIKDGTVGMQCSFADIPVAPVNFSNQALQDAYLVFRKRFQPLVQIARTLIDSSYTAVRGSRESSVYTMLYEKVLQVENEVAERFAAENSNNMTGAYVLYRYARTEDPFHYDSLYKLFPVNLQSSAYLENVKQKITAMRTLQIGKRVPAIQDVTMDGNQINSDEWIGKYVVLDFWGSWCQPCIKGMPTMKEYYTRYGDSVQFVGIACSDEDSSWRKAVQQHGLNWPQLFSNTKKNKLAERFNVESYPTKIILDKTGRLIEIFTGENDAFYQKLDQILSHKP